MKSSEYVARTDKSTSPFQRTLATLAAIISIWIIVACLAAPVVVAQTAATGALSGTVTDPNGAVVPGVDIKVTNEGTGESRTVTSRTDGSFTAPLLPPGSYRFEAVGQGFKRGTGSGVTVEVTETARLDIQLEVGGVGESVLVTAEVALVQTDSSTLGRVTDAAAVTGLPLVARNYTQILGLSPGVTTNVTNAGEVGRGSGGTSGNFGGGVGGSGTYVHGARSYENNFQMNGVGINDLQANGTFSGGVAIPNPDTIQTFKVQTGLYDAAFGRNAGANVNVVTKGGSNAFHGSAFEFFRNDVLNANDFFSNRAGRKKGILRQNQYGFTLGGPIKQDKLLFFGSYQGNRQANGLANPVTVFAPALTNDRSIAALGSLFAGQRGGNNIAIRADGSNINPIAIKLLQLKLPDGGFLIPTPQRIDPSQPFARRGSSTFTVPRFFNEDQYMVNLDFLHTAKSKLEGRFFYADGESFSDLPAGGNTPGFPIAGVTGFRNFTLSHSYIISANLFNEARLGFNRTLLTQGPPSVPFRFSDVGVNAPPQADGNPAIGIGGSHTLIPAPITSFIQNHYSVGEILSYVRGSSTFRFGGDLTFSQVNTGFGASATVNFATFPDFLLGLNAAQSVAQGGTAASNVQTSAASLGLRDRALRVRSGSLFLQDDFKVSRRLTLNLGLRYERIGHIYDKQGRNTNFDFALANPNPPASGSLAGFVVPEHFAGGSVPVGVTQLDGKLVVNGDGQNAFQPRVGFAWQVLPNSSRLVLRGGYGLYYSRLASQTPFQLSFSQPFALALTTPLGGVASFSNPFPPSPSLSDFPVFVPYTPTSNLTFSVLSPDYRPSKTQQYSLNLQTQLARDFLLEVGYVGTHGTHLLRTRSVNQALLASLTNPIRGLTTNTPGNIAQRVPFQGISSGAAVIETAGESWYNGLEGSVTKRFSRGLQLLASYTFSKSLDTDGANVEATGNATRTIGNQNDPRSRYGRTAYDRTHRFIFSYVYNFPLQADGTGLHGKVLGGWGISGVTTIQTGQPLTFTALNANNVFFGTSLTDRAQLSPDCTHADLTTSGPITDRLNGYFNRACFFTNGPLGPLTVPIAPPTIGTGVGFGNSGVGIVDGPGQNNSDFAVFKRTPLRWPTEASNVEFRAEFFNVFNHPQFANPATNAGTAGQVNFGTITVTSVSPRVIQFGLKFNF